MKEILFDILKGLLVFGAISNTLYVASINTKNLARAKYLEEKYSCCDNKPENYDRLTKLENGWTIIESMKNYGKAWWFTKEYLKVLGR